MLRCGAKAICAEAYIPNDYSENDWPEPPEQIFGWPTTGGVWILRRPKRIHLRDPNTGEDTSEEFAMQRIRYGEFRKSLQRYTAMDELCRAMQSTGAQFYAAIEDCPEARELGLDAI